MASGTADLQRDLGGAIMQSLLGALLTAGYAKSVTAMIASAPASTQQAITSDIQGALTKSYAGAQSIAAQYPQYADAIMTGARQSFLDGADAAYAAGIVAIVIGAALVLFAFPKHDRERELLAGYARQDSGPAAAPEATAAPTKGRS
jgi:hypothetical protein